jgi:formylglycine-generating enzyme required for sulfatase activity
MHRATASHMEGRMAIAAVATKTGGLVLPSLLLAGLLTLVGLQTEAIHLPAFRMAPAAAGPQTVLIPSHPFAYRAGGDFIRGTASIDGPLVEVDEPAPLEIMKYQVSAADYAQCVADGACERADPRRHGAGHLPVTGVSFNDATDYADWLSRRTGETWRLPTIEEWAFAAGSKAVDHALGIDANAADPAQRWLFAYERESALSTDGPANPEPLGSFGVNEFGVADLSAVVWEWTATCASRTTLDAAGETLSHIEACGVRYLEGRHRTPMSAFVRDALGGGCSVGVPPDNIGFRLVRDPSGLAFVGGAFARFVGAG